MLHGARHSFGFDEWDIGPIPLSHQIPSLISIYLVIRVQARIATRRVRKKKAEEKGSYSHKQQ